MEWIAIDVHIAGDAVTHRLADAFRLRVAEAAGLLTLAFAGMAQHAQDGSLSSVTDSQIESWAYWQGKRGAFAAFFRAQLCDERGTVRAWEKYNGANIREAHAARERMRGYRARKKAERSAHGTEHGTANGSGNGTANGTRDVRHNMTGQDRTELQDQQLPASPPEKPAAIVKVPKPKRPPLPFMGRLNATWKRHYGGEMPKGSATILEPVVADVGEEEADARLDAYCERTEADFASIRNFAAKHGAYGDTLGVDPATGTLNGAGLKALGIGGRR
jgi:hypothetical protein